MECALKLQAIAAAKVEENRLREVEAEAKRKVNTFNQTMKYCEQIGKKLEEMANAGYTPRVYFLFDYDYYHPNYGFAMEEDHRSPYADKRTTHHRIGEEFDLEVMKEWFAQYCFTLRYYTTYTWKYGHGSYKIYGVIIEPSPECKK